VIDSFGGPSIGGSHYGMVLYSHLETFFWAGWGEVGSAEKLFRSEVNRFNPKMGSICCGRDWEYMTKLHLLLMRSEFLAVRRGPLL
jgi:hypothetical protein